VTVKNTTPEKNAPRFEGIAFRTIFLSDDLLENNPNFKKCLLTGTWPLRVWFDSVLKSTGTSYAVDEEKTYILASDNYTGCTSVPVKLVTQIAELAPNHSFYFTFFPDRPFYILDPQEEPQLMHTNWWTTRYHLNRLRFPVFFFNSGFSLELV
jgi:hypothetical protein